jgi:hypothetical protein
MFRTNPQPTGVYPGEGSSECKAINWRLSRPRRVSARRKQANVAGALARSRGDLALEKPQGWKASLALQFLQ